MEDEHRYYEILGLNHNASSSEITKAYRSLAKTYHPDVSSHPRARENFLRIREAYEALSNPDKRAEYDAYLDDLEQSAYGEDGKEDFEGFFIENTFSARNETITINGRDHTFDIVRHVIANGQEYIEYNDQLLSFDRGDFPFDTSDIEDEFYTHKEDIAIDGTEYTFKNAHHVVIDGQEYIEYQGNFLPLEITEDEESSPPRGGFFKLLAYLAILIMVVFTAYHGYLIATSGNSAIIPDAGEDVSTGNQVQPISPEEEYSQKIMDAIDPEDPITRNYALSLIDESHGGTRNIAQVCDIWEKCYTQWTYVSDPKGFEYFSSASNTIQLGLKGDCDDFAVLIASLTEAIGGTARVILAQGANGGGHAYAEVYVTDNKADFDSIAHYICERYNCQSVAYHIEYDSDRTPRYWLNLDWQSKHPGGKFYDSSGTLTAYYSNGKWKKIEMNN